MYGKVRNRETVLEINTSYEAESLEVKINRMLNNGEPIGDEAPLIYTDRKDGVGKQFDIRTDRFDEAYEAMDKVSKAYKARREDPGAVIEPKKEGEKGGEKVSG